MESDESSDSPHKHQFNLIQPQSHKNELLKEETEQKLRITTKRSNSLDCSNKSPTIIENGEDEKDEEPELTAVEVENQLNKLLQTNNSQSEEEDSDDGESYMSTQKQLQNRIKQAKAMQVPHRQYTPVEQNTLTQFNSNQLMSPADSSNIDEFVNQLRNRRRKPFEVKCKCGYEGMTKVTRRCTCATCCMWCLIVSFFFCCIWCIFCYAPCKQDDSYINNYLECKCLHRTITHRCARCQRLIHQVHPEVCGDGFQADEEAINSSRGSSLQQSQDSSEEDD